MVENLGLDIITYYRVSQKFGNRIMGQLIIYNQIGCRAAKFCHGQQMQHSPQNSVSNFFLRHLGTLWILPAYLFALPSLLSRVAKIDVVNVSVEPARRTSLS